MQIIDATMDPVHLGGTAGHLFWGEIGNGVCFVPEACTEFQSDGRITLDEVGYVVGGWARKNGLLNPLVAGHRLYPNLDAPISDFDAPEVAQFLGRARVFPSV